MSYDSYIDHSLETGFVRLSGYVDAEQIVEAANAMYQDSEWRPHYNSLWDFRPTREVDITPSGLSKILTEKKARDAEGLLQGKITGVINRPAVMFFGKLIQIRASSAASKVKVFNREKDAWQWIGLPEDVNAWEWHRDDTHV